MPFRGVHALACGAFALIVSLAGCLDDPGVSCPDGTVCPSGTACVALAGTTRCATPEQRAACAGVADSGPCQLPGGAPGVCNQGVCVRPGCGDGFLSAGERCEGTLLGGETCVSRGFNSGDLGCTAECTFDVSACQGRCGDGLVSDDEDCDPGAPELGIAADLAGQTCTTVGFYQPAGLACNAACRLDTSACGGGRCGDAVINGDEQCDGDQLAGADCQSAGGFYAAPGLTCNTACRYDFAACTGRCGDGAINGAELCDPGVALDAAHDTCGDFGFYDAARPVTCSGVCQYDISACGPRCGDERIDTAAGEECDGAPPVACNAYGPTGFDGHDDWYGGSVRCTSSCRIDAAECTAAGRCGDRRRNGAEACDGGPAGGEQMDEVSDPVTDFGGQTCQTAALFTDRAPRYLGLLYCSPTCTIDTRTSDPVHGCHDYCGDQVRNGPEACDGADFPGDASCRSFGYQSGSLLCVTACRQIFIQCDDPCGDGIISGDETCDGATSLGLDASCGVFGQHGALGCNSFCQRDLSACEDDAWTQTEVLVQPRIQENGRIAALWTARKDDVWAVVDDVGRRELFHGDGTRWAHVIGPEVVAFAGLRDGTLWIGDLAQQVWQRTDTGWIEVGPPLPEAVVALWADSTRLFAATTHAVWRFQVDHWALERALGSQTAIAMHGVPDGRLYVLTFDTGSFVHERLGDNQWSSTALPFGGPPLKAIVAHSADLIWVVGGDGPALVGARNRGTWEMMPAAELTASGTTPIPGTAVGIGGEPDNLWLVGVDPSGRGYLMQSEGLDVGGLRFRRQIGTFPAFGGLTASPEGDLWAFGDGPIVAHRDGAGLVAPTVPGIVFDSNTIRGWLFQALPRSIAVGRGDVIIGADGPGGGVVHHRPGYPFDTGALPALRWVRELIPNSRSIVVARTATEIWAFGDFGQADRWNGVQWTAIGSPVQIAMAAFATGGRLYVIDVGAGVVRQYDGAAWSVITTVPPGVEAIGGTAPDDLWLVGSSAYHWDGVTLSPVSATVGHLRGVWASSRDDVWAVGDNGLEGYVLHKTLRSSSGLGFFARVEGAAPANLPPMNAIWGANPRDLWAVGDGGTILHYDGLRWVPVTPSRGASAEHLLAIGGLDADTVWTVGRNGALFRLSARLPPSSPRPCADAVPLYCSGLDQSATPIVPLVGTLPVGGVVRYRLDPPFEASVYFRVDVAPDGPTPTLQVRILDGDFAGACTTTELYRRSEITTGLDVPVIGPTTPPLVLSPHHAVYVEVSAPGATSPLGYTLDASCGRVP